MTPLRRSLLWSAGLLGLGLAVWVAAQLWQSRPPDFSAISWADRARLGELFWAVTGNPEAYEPGMTRAARQVFDRYQPATTAQRDAMRETGRAMADLHRLFWQDALQSVARGRPVKSPERKRLEQRLITEGFLVPLRVETLTGMMKRIAAREPIMTNHGVEMVMDEATIRRVLASQDDQEITAVVLRVIGALRAD